jgi:hypothetical protein
MAWLESLVTHVGDVATRNVASMVHAAPRRGPEADLRAAHDQWKRGARTGLWFLPDASLEWVQNGWEDPKVVCVGGFNFTRDSGDLFWTGDGKRSSWEAWRLADGRGLTQTPPGPPKPLQGLGAGSEYRRLLAGQGWDRVEFH